MAVMVEEELWRVIRVPFRREPRRSKLGIVGTHPGSFRKSGKQRGYGIRNLEEGTEDGRQGGMLEGRVGELNAETQRARR